MADVGASEVTGYVQVEHSFTRVVVSGIYRLEVCLANQVWLLDLLWENFPNLTVYFVENSFFLVASVLLRRLAFESVRPKNRFPFRIR